MSLATIQTEFQNYLLNNDSAIKKSIVNNEEVDSEQRLNIYYEAYRLRIMEALCDSYEILHTYLGDEQFFALGGVYIEQNPSEFRSIRWYGANLAEFILTMPEYADHPYLAELAKFEWTLTEVFDSPDCQPLQLECLQNISPELWPELRFAVQPEVRRLNFVWNVVEIYNALNNEQHPPEPKIYEFPESWVLWRNNYVTEFCSLSVEAAWMIDQIIAHKNFTEICEGLCEWLDEDQVALHAASLLKEWVQSGLIHDVK